MTHIKDTSTHCWLISINNFFIINSRKIGNYKGINERSIGYKLGIGGIITYKNAKTIKEVVKDTDLAYILLETDSPYLAPVPHRGEDNNPKYIPIIADEIASIKGTSSLDIARVTTANAEAVFDFSCEKWYN